MFSVLYLNMNINGKRFIELDQGHIVSEVHIVVIWMNVNLGS